jgi:hypothetical protein
MGAIGFGLVAAGLWQAGWIGSGRRLTSICWLGDGRWLLTHNDCNGGQNTVPAELCADTRLLGPALWLRWKTGRASRRSMLLIEDDVAPEQLRRLLVRLRIMSTEWATERALPEPGSA